MSVKKTSSPFSSGAEPLEPLDSKELKQSGKIGEGFEAALSEVEEGLEQAGEASGSGSAERSTLSNIASNAQLDTPDGAIEAVKESAKFLVQSRLNEGFRDSKQGEKMTEELSEYIARDPFLNRKILGILQRLK